MDKLTFSGKDWKWTRSPQKFLADNDKIEIVTAPHTDLWQRTYYHFRNDSAPLLRDSPEDILPLAQRRHSGIMPVLRQRTLSAPRCLPLVCRPNNVLCASIIAIYNYSNKNTYVNK